MVFRDCLYRRRAHSGGNATIQLALPVPVSLNHRWPHMAGNNRCKKGSGRGTPLPLKKTYLVLFAPIHQAGGSANRGAGNAGRGARRARRAGGAYRLAHRHALGNAHRHAHLNGLAANGLANHCGDADRGAGRGNDRGAGRTRDTALRAGAGNTGYHQNSQHHDHKRLFHTNAPFFGVSSTATTGGDLSRPHAYESKTSTYIAHVLYHFRTPYAFRSPIIQHFISIHYRR